VPSFLADRLFDGHAEVPAAFEGDTKDLVANLEGHDRDCLPVLSHETDCLGGLEDQAHLVFPCRGFDKEEGPPLDFDPAYDRGMGGALCIGHEHLAAGCEIWNKTEKRHANSLYNYLYSTEAGHQDAEALPVLSLPLRVGIAFVPADRTVVVEVALRRAGDRAKMAVMASDAYFPFPDAIAHAAIAGVTAIVQPGGSRRDEMAIEVADRHHLAMVFTGRRHFRH